MHARSLFAFVATTLLAVACAAPAPPSADLAAEEKTVRDISMQWLNREKARDAAGVVAVMADDAVLYRQHKDPIVGTAAIKDYLTKDYSDNPKADITWSSTSVRVAKSGDLAIETGTFHVTGAGPKADVEDRGNYITVYSKASGQWKITHDIGSSTMPDPAKAKAGG